jgi:hypothetical protein
MNRTSELGTQARLVVDRRLGIASRRAGFFAMTSTADLPAVFSRPFNF